MAKDQAEGIDVGLQPVLQRARFVCRVIDAKVVCAGGVLQPLVDVDPIGCRSVAAGPSARWFQTPMLNGYAIQIGLDLAAGRLAPMPRM
ncbi:MAG: hypothetical protein IPM01_30895 [Burkholderiaceae bacterium]|nr:hypothetical protein [Burkholderiaceae bacterium]